MTALLMILFGFVVPSAIGILAMRLLRGRLATAFAGVALALVTVGAAAVVVASYFLLAAILGGITEPRDLPTFLSFAGRMTALTLPIWVSIGMLMPWYVRHIRQGGPG